MERTLDNPRCKTSMAPCDSAQSLNALPRQQMKLTIVDKLWRFIDSGVGWFRERGGLSSLEHVHPGQSNPVPPFGCFFLGRLAG